MENAPADSAIVAAFFDVDGTLVNSTIIHYYVYLRCRRMSPAYASLWHSVYPLKCVYYFLLDKISRRTLNIVFYRSYAGLPAAEIKALAPDCHREIIKRRRFPQAIGCVEEHRRAGHRVVLVTGSIDFLVQPLAAELGAHDVVAATLVESNGTFTGELAGPPISEQEKARRVRQYADVHGIDLSLSYAYGDSVADLPMLEAVGFPHAVNPDRALAKAARARGWPLHRWTIADSQVNNAP